MIAWLLLLAAAVAAPLDLDEVLGAVDDRVPQLAAAQAKLEEAEGKLLAARGGFDPVLSAKAGTYAGKDPRDLASVGLGVQTLLGPELAAGWSLGRGDFPTYDPRDSGPGGEWWLRGTIPVLDGLGMPEARAKLLVARAGADLTAASVDAKRVELRLKAAAAYWKWVAAGAKLDVEEALLEQAETRNRALTREVDQGARPRIDLLDNERVVLQRRDTATQARRDLEIAAIALSLWFRDADGRPVAPEREAVPALSPDPEGELPSLDADLQRAEVRPDVRALDALIEAARVERARAGNALLPDLDLVGEAILPLDPDTTEELYAGAELKLPTLLRKERGTLAAADAVVEGLDATRGGTIDLARTEIEASRVGIETASQRVRWTRSAEERATEVVQLEQRRFELGGGDVFQLLTRESNLAKARKAAVDAALDLHLAEAARAAAVAELP